MIAVVGGEQSLRSDKPARRGRYIVGDNEELRGNSPTRDDRTDQRGDSHYPSVPRHTQVYLDQAEH